MRRILSLEDQILRIIQIKVKYLLKKEGNNLKQKYLNNNINEQFNNNQEKFKFIQLCILNLI